MRMPPLAVISQWPTPNYIDPETQGPAILIVNGILIVFVLIAVSGRFYSRIVIKKWLGIDDYMCALALVFTIATTIVVILANSKYYWNRHIWDLPLGKIQQTNIIAFAGKLTFTFAATFIRLSLICFYYRLIKDSGIKWFNWVLHAAVVWTASVCITFVVLTIWLCDPIEAYWTFPPGGQCLDEGKVMLGGGIVNSVSDFLTTILPIPIVLRLQMPLKQRIGVCILLCLGLVVTIAGSLRTYYTWKSLMASWDETWWAYWLWVAASIELDLGLICSCAPAWKSLLQKPMRKLSSKISSLRSPSKASNSPTSSGTIKKSIFNPARSLPWFQITRFEFEKTQQDPNEYALQDLERCLEPDNPSNTTEPDAGAKDFQFSDIIEEDARPTTPVLQITRRQSVDQTSTRTNGSPVKPAEWYPGRDSISCSARR